MFFLLRTFRHLMKHETDDFMGRISIPIEVGMETFLF